MAVAPLRCAGLLAALPVVLQCVLAAPAQAQVRAGGLGTRVNGSLFGNCGVGRCAVNGGTRAGDNLFLRFSQLDTRSGVGEVHIDAAGRRNVILGVTHPEGTFLNSRLSLRDPATLFLLSPGGLWLGRGAEFQRVPSLLLSTGIALDLPGGRFHAISSTAEDLAGLGVGPRFRFDAVAVPGGQPGLVAAAGTGALVIDNGLLRVDRGLILDAGSSSLRLRQAELSAGQSVRLSGGSLDLRDSSVSAGDPGQRGLVELRTAQDPSSGAYGSGLLQRVSLSGAQVSVTAGTLRLLESRIQAPKGWVELQAINPAGLAADLLLERSTIDLNPSNAADLWSPQRIRRQQEDGSVQELTNSIPHLGLFARGDLRLVTSTIEASLTLPAGPEPDPAAVLAALPPRAGVVFAEAGGSIGIEASRLRADASHTLAGFLLLEAGRQLGDTPGLGSLELHNSQLSTSHGAGFGVIVLQANNGLTLRDSTIRAITDRHPVVPWFTPKDGAPLAYIGGAIALYNSAFTQPLQVSGTVIEALHHSGGGGLASPFLGPLDERFGLWGTFGSVRDAWTNGLQYSYSGGFLQLYSQGGIRVDQGSSLDVSSRDPATGRLENTAGLVALISTGERPIVIDNASISSRSGSPRDPADRDHMAGLAYLYSEGDLLLRDARLDLTSTTTIDSSTVYPETQGFLDPFASLEAGGRLSISGASDLRVLSAAFTGPPLPPTSDAFFGYGLNLFGSLGVELGPEVSLQGPVHGVEDPSGAADYLRYFQEVVENNRVYFERTYTGSASGLPAWQLPLATEVSGSLPPPELAVLPAGPPQAVEIQAELDAGQQLLEGQQQALADTVAGLGLPAGSGRVRSVAELQQRLSRVVGLRAAAATATAPAAPATATAPAAYRPAILQLQRSDLPDGQVQLTAILLSPGGEPVSRSQVLPGERLNGAIRSLQRQLSRQEWIDPAGGQGAAASLAGWLLEPLADELRASGSTALLLAVDRGLQAIPYGALPVEGQPLAERFALSVSPSLGLLDLDSDATPGDGLLLLAGASEFGASLQPLPMVPRELGALAGEQPATLLLEEAFTAEALRRQAAELRHQRLHIATHADFQPGRNDAGRLFTRQGSLSLVELGGSLRARAQQRPLDLITLSACSTALGDERSELGFVGMALQAGARSGIGTLWKVDDAATAAFFVQYYRYLRSGLGKDQALQATVAAFRRGAVRLEGEQLVGPQVSGAGRAPLLAVASPRERQRLSAGLSHPYFWAGMVLTGTPW